ncbi:MAG: hypothetical protein K2G78_05290, partial [Muribaculaceae bacterium]|nr:hypothetical protein [Muribaculaceae bacterium]
FAVGQGVVLRHLFMLHGRWWAIGLLTVVVAGVAAAFAVDDVRWFICGLMVLLIVAPMVMALLYVNYALDGDCAFNVLPHTLSLHSEGVLIRIWTRAAADGGDGDCKEAAGDEDDDWGSEKRRKRKRKRKKSLWDDMDEWPDDSKPAAAEEERRDADCEERIVERIVPYAALHPVRLGMGAVVVLWRDNRRGIMLVPPGAFSDKAGFEGFVSELSAHIRGSVGSRGEADESL